MNFKSTHRVRLQPLLFLALLLLTVNASHAWQGKVTGVLDGSTITVLHDGKGEKICLYGIDCPQKHQDFWDNAKRFTSDQVLGKIVDVEPITKDRYGRTVGIVTIESKILDQELIKAGLAWVYTKYCTRPECRDWKMSETEAKRQKLGLWSMANPIPPWEYRHGKDQNPVFHGDVATHIFHSSNCEDYDCKHCIAVFRGREKALSAGYKPCQGCKP